MIPDRSLEAALLGHHQALVGIDEVGRGALAGPVCVGAAVVTPTTAPQIPDGLRDSKLITAAARPEIAARARTWVAASAVGSATAAEIDERGIIAALRLAASRALAELAESGLAPLPTAAILDGSHNWLETTLLDSDLPHLDFRQIVVRPKADAHCAVVAAASVIAKTRRDAYMETLEDPGYGFASNKGYGVPGHLAALRAHGPCDHHRRSWRLAGTGKALTDTAGTGGAGTTAASMA
ncbi:MAG TPA: ribonuclease HII [Actinomycetaceae bacterium]|nr:ribonuclease HII [Actinomycetaceae bacterium]